jgi:hypothetical protein
MAERILKNQTANIIKINDLGGKEIPEYGEVDFGACYNLSMLAESDDLATALVKDIDSNGFSQYLILNDGDHDLKAIDAIDLIRDIQQKSTVTTDGDYQVVLKDSAHISTNSVVDKKIGYYLAVGTKFIKKFKIPQDKIWYIENIGGSSEDTCAQINFYYEKNGIMINPFVDACCDYELQNTQVVNPNDTIINISCFNNEIDFAQAGLYYHFESEDENDDESVYRKIIDIDKGNNTITIDQPLGFTFDIGGYIALAEKPIRSLMVEKVTNFIPFNSPLPFTGQEGNSFIVFELINTNNEMDTRISCFLNGWEEPIS